MAKRKTARTLSLRTFATQLGVSVNAVSKAVKSGRLMASIGRNPKGDPVVRDVELAKKEWSANASKVTKAGGATLSEAQRQVAVERAKGMRLANLQKRRRLIPVDEAKREAFDAARTIRESILNLPARLSAELAAETDANKVHLLLDRELRQALGAAADKVLAVA